MYEPIAADLAVRLTRQHVASARLDARVIPERPHRQRLSGARTRFAAHLHRLASWLEPADRCQVASSRG